MNLIEALKRASKYKTRKQCLIFVRRTKAYNIINGRRGHLINKSVYTPLLMKESEKKELKKLQNLVGRLLNGAYPRRRLNKREK